MRWGRWSVVIPIVGTLGVSLTGVAWGYLEKAPGPSLGQLAFLAGGFLGLAGLFRGSISGERVR